MKQAKQVIPVRQTFAVRGILFLGVLLLVFLVMHPREGFASAKEGMTLWLNTLLPTLLPFMILAVYSSVEKMDWDLVEAARDLGASPLKAFLTVTLKLTLPGLLSGVILTFIPSMGLFFIADILGGNKIVLVGSLIQEQMTRGNNWPFAAALAVVLMILTTLMIILYRKLTNVKELEGIG